MRITLADKQNKIKRDLIIINNQDEMLICNEDGKKIASIEIGNMWVGGPDDSREPHEKNFFLSFTPNNQQDVVDSLSCNVGVYNGR